MAEPLTINVTRAAVSAPATYTVPGSAEVEPLAAFARFDGTAAASPFYPSLAFYSAAGILIARVFPELVSAGGTADVTFTPKGGGGGASSATRQVTLAVDTPDSVGNGFAVFAGGAATAYGFTNLRALVPAFAQSLDGTWEGRTRIPDDYQANGTIVLGFAVDAVAGTVRTRVSSTVVAAGVSENTAYTNEAYVNTTVPATANLLYVVSFPLTPTLVAGAALNYKFTREGSNAADTCLQDALMIFSALTYTG